MAKALSRVYRDAAGLLQVSGLSKGAMARDVEGRIVRLDAPEASYYCAWGALLLASGG